VRAELTIAFIRVTRLYTGLKAANIWQQKLLDILEHVYVFITLIVVNDTAKVGFYRASIF
jgi:hypothetical protein